MALFFPSVLLHHTVCVFSVNLCQQAVVSMTW